MPPGLPERHSPHAARESSPFDKTLFVLAQVPHWTGPDGTPWAYEPYVREMRIWADLFAKVEICHPAGSGVMKGNLAPYDRANVLLRPVEYPLSTGAPGALRRLVALPRLFRAAYGGIIGSDLVLLRSPAHFGLIGAFLSRALRRPSVTKWAGENGAFSGERLPSRVDRLLQGIRSDLNPVLVYGAPRRAHHIEFLPALMSRDEIGLAQSLSSRRSAGPPWNILSVGRLIPVKGFDLALSGLALLRRSDASLAWRYTLVGEGEARGRLEALAADLGIGDRVRFTGALPFGRVQELYAESHVVIMPGTKEGWPKVIAEAWAHGAVPVAARAGLVPHILRKPDSGVVFDADPASLARALKDLLADQESFEQFSSRARPWADELSLEQFRVRLEEVLRTRFALDGRTK